MFNMNDFFQLFAPPHWPLVVGVNNGYLFIFIIIFFLDGVHPHKISARLNTSDNPHTQFLD